MLQLTIIILPYTVVSVKKIPVYKRDGVNQIMAYIQGGLILSKGVLFPGFWPVN